MELFLNGVQASLDGLFLDDEIADNVYRSLFTWARADEGEEQINGKKYGWWGDIFNSRDKYGSKLWKFKRTKITATTTLEIEQVVKDALQWMIEDCIATEINVKAQRTEQDQINLTISTTINGENANIYFKDLLNGIST